MVGFYLPKFVTSTLPPPPPLKNMTGTQESCTLYFSKIWSPMYPIHPIKNKTSSNPCPSPDTCIKTYRLYYILYLDLGLPLKIKFCEDISSGLMSRKICRFFFFFFFFIKHLYPGYPTRLEAVTNVGSCTTYLITQTIGLQHISTNIYTQLYTYMNYHMIWYSIGNFA